MRKRHSALIAMSVAGLAWACSSSDGGVSPTPGSSATASGGSAGNPPATSGGRSPGGAGGDGGRAGGGAPSGNGGAVSAAGQASSGGAAGHGGAPALAGASGGSSGGSGGAAAPRACPAAPDGTPDNALKALDAINAIRGAMGVECANLVLTLDKSAQAHCDFYSANTAVSTCESDAISPHNEVLGCTGFTGVSPGDRVKAAGYVGRGWAEVMAFNNDPIKAVNQWVNSVWHRTPLLSPWWDDLGYGNAAKCDVIDLGPGTQSPTSTTVMYPYPGQVGVPRSFDGSLEGPEPPTPPTGWPSGLPITLYVQNAKTVSHTIEVQGSGVPLDHQWIDYGPPENDTDQLIMYTNAPFSAKTTYHVTIAVTIAGSPKTFDWTFVTGS